MDALITSQEVLRQLAAFGKAVREAGHACLRRLQPTGKKPLSSAAEPSDKSSGLSYSVPSSSVDKLYTGKESPINILLIAKSTTSCSVLVEGTDSLTGISKEEVSVV